MSSMHQRTYNLSIELVRLNVSEKQKLRCRDVQK